MSVELLANSSEWNMSSFLLVGAKPPVAAGVHRRSVEVSSWEVLQRFGQKRVIEARHVTSGFPGWLPAARYPDRPCSHQADQSQGRHFVPRDDLASR